MTVLYWLTSTALISFAVGIVCGWVLRVFAARNARADIAEQVRRDIQNCDVEIHGDVTRIPYRGSVR